MSLLNRAVFLDRDGVLIHDSHLLTRLEEIEILPEVPQSLRTLFDSGFKLIIISNQTVVARGIMTEKKVLELQKEIEQRIINQRGPKLDGFYFCPHHPQANLPEYRISCSCRKPKTGLFLRAALDFDIDLSQSFMVGDRFTDIVAGSAAGCRTILVETGAHLLPPIETTESLDFSIRPDYTCTHLSEASFWILRQT